MNEIINRRGSRPKDKSVLNDTDDELEIGNPLVHLVYEFLTDARSSRIAYIWATLTCWMVIVRVLAIGLESCDGPNQYYGRDADNSRFHFLLTEPQYWNVYITCMVPLIIDVVGRILTLCFVILGEENVDLFEQLMKDKLEIFMFVCDILGVIPFLITAVYIRPKRVELSQASNLVMTMIELLITTRVLRLIRDIPAVRAIRIALSRSAPHLILPLFFFFVFNITAGVFLYFAEPCYDTLVCPWRDLFQSTYYSVVSMTTTGYGNQVPSFEFGRFVACCVMIFGSLFLSMPLAIIGNEYDKAWFDITEQIRIKAENKLKEEEELRELMQRRKMPLSSEQQQSKIAISDAVKEALEREERERQKIESNKIAAANSSIMTCHKNIIDLIQKLKNECKNVNRIQPNILLLFCEIRSWIPTFSHQINTYFDFLQLEKDIKEQAQKHAFFYLNAGSGSNATGGGSGNASGNNGAIPRRLSVFGGANAAAKATSPQINNSLGNTIAVAPNTANFQPFQHNNNTAVNTNLRTISEHDDEDEDTRGRIRGNNNSNYNNRNKNKGIDYDNDNDDDDYDEDEESGGELHIAKSRRKNHRLVPESDDIKSRKKSNEITRMGELPKRMTKSNSVLARVLPPARNRDSMYSRFLKVMGVEDDIRRRSVSEDFMIRMEKISHNPTTLRSRIWILLELPHSSKEARFLQIILIFLISMSIFVLYTETITSLTRYGEHMPICGRLLKAYCVDKTDPSKDPGCFIFNGTSITQDKLLYDCTSTECFGYGYNFGSLNTNLTCLPSNYSITPFQTKEQLIYTYGAPYVFTSREEMHKINAICHRVECEDNGYRFVDGQLIWIVAEFVVNIIFSIELILRIAVTESLWAFVKDKMNLFDILSVFPFYVELINTRIHGSFSNLSFAVLASSPQPIFIVTMRSLKVFRMFKMTRHFQASKVLIETAKKVWKQILGMISLLAFLVVLFAIFLYRVEGGKPCYVGDPGCIPPPNIKPIVHTGDRILINKLGGVSQFGNVFYGIWFSFVTMTTTGYGDITPVTNAGQVMAIFLMISGTFYMAMPLTAAASTFYQVHETYENKTKSNVVAPIEDKKEDKRGNSLTNLPLEEILDLRMIVSIKNIITELYITQTSMSSFFYELNSPVDPATTNHKHQSSIESDSEYHNDSDSSSSTKKSKNNKVQQQQHNLPQSELLKTIVRLVSNLEKNLISCERDLITLVITYNEYRMRSLNESTRNIMKNVENSRGTTPANMSHHASPANSSIIYFNDT